MIEIDLLWVIIGIALSLTIGASIGVLILACLVMAKRADEAN